MDEHTQPTTEPQPQAVAPEQPIDQPEISAVPKRRLGRGLNALLGEPAEGEAVAETAEIPGALAEYKLVDVNAIQSNPFQPRKEFDQAELEELAASIAQHGILQPIVVRQVEGGFQLVAGERRLMAARKVGLDKVPCRLVTKSDLESRELAIIENLQRADLNEMEKAIAFQAYLDQTQTTIEELAKRLGKDRSTVSNCLRLLELPEFVKKALREGRISAGHARSLLPLDEEADQIAMCQQIVSEGLNVRQTEELVREKVGGSATLPFEGNEGSKKSGPKRIPRHVVDLQNQLRDALGTKVEIKLKSKDAGRMIIHFSSNDEFERIVGFLKKVA
jgi:ParB family transcriptional regulator, chromosome partitioning protein